ncbi:hypothetical protein DICVIV_00518 [Dictyocaulus viviparus]|uniref:Uncharacterized protein n=1 Tax=Dictyocaulus viviparus TaxID=29172 RepID=A0A0D8YAL3_DICVI|nr:hypothetical protein DICVIV_00518 [Dictyocaulus viviparus]
MFDSAIVIFLECVAVFVPLYYSMVAARWINSSSKAINVLSSVSSSKKISHGRMKRMHIDHGDSVSSLGSAEVEKKVKTLRHEIGDSALELSSRTASATKI